jgi:hypothetical protein
LAGWLATEIIRATVKNGNHYPQVDFIAESKQCQRCGGNLRVQKSKKRIVSTIETGTIQVREIRKVCSQDSSHPVETSETLSRMVPCGQRYGYDLIVWIGVGRYLRNLQRQEIRTELFRQKGIILSDGSISEICNRFLLYFEALHITCAPTLRAAMEKGYPLHIDATNEYGKGGLFLCLDGWRGWVLHAAKIATENAEELRPAIDKTLSLFGDPVAVVRDLGGAGAKSVDSLRQKNIPDLVCHFHFLGAIGKKLFDASYSSLRKLLQRSKVRSGLRELLRELRKNHTTDIYDGELGCGWMRKALPALILWVLEGEGGKDLPFPFCLPHLNFYQRCCELAQRVERWMSLPRSQVERRVLKKAFSITARLDKIEHFGRVVPRLEKSWKAFCELRDILRLTDAELPRGNQRKLINREFPSLEAERLRDIEEKTTVYHEEIRQRVTDAQKESQKAAAESPEAIILKYLDRYSSHLFGHPLLIDDDGNILAVVERTNNVAEHFFGGDKQKLRRRLGRANLGRDLEDQPAQAVLISNLNHPDYVKITCGSLDNLPAAFAELDRGEFKNESTLQRSNKDTDLINYICAMIADEKMQIERICN